MTATLKGLGSNGDRRIAVLGAMKELGRQSAKFSYRALRAPIEAAGVDWLLLVGEEMAPLAEALLLMLPGRKFAHCASVAEASERLRSEVRGGDAILIKGSNSVGLRGGRGYCSAEGIDVLLARAIFRFCGFLNLFRYLTFRSGAAVGTAFLIGLIIGPRFISMLRVRQGKGQPIRSDGPQTHLAKVGTPTMGGLMILTSIAISMLLWMDLTNSYVWACCGDAGFGLVGFMDDYDKVKKRSTKGFRARSAAVWNF
jgi:hypothetical protein